MLLERLVTNLVHNAIHYNERGGSVAVKLPVQARTVANDTTGPQVMLGAGAGD
ncbi:hypothetical protein [Actinophytocola oryzae]|uniref:Uncharacterized protein n=1 Tax=Actinophytocola oryzae TaxID=502181 RepID=A0A4R7UY65_9PSEU|nr:hypothetical protein CLV71_119131 [Actinophytocola oryzae]